MTFQIAQTILSALSQGYPIVKIIENIAKNNKAIGSHIKSALKQGYSHDEIGEYLTKRGSLSYGQREQKLSGMTEKERAERTFYRGEDASGVLNAAIPLAKAGAIGYLGSKIAQNLPKQSGGAGSQILPEEIRSKPAVIPEVLPAQSSPKALPSPMDLVSKQEIDVEATPVPVQEKAQDIPSEQILTSMGIKPQVDNMIKSGNTPEDISSVLNLMIKGNQRREVMSQIKAGKIPPLISLVTDYTNKVANQPKPVESPAINIPPSTSQQPVSSNEPEIQNPIQDALPKQPQKIEEAKSGSVIALQDGQIGKIESVKKGIATVDVNGKKIPVHLKDVELEPAEVVELVHGALKIPESERSRLVSFFGYDPDRKELFVQFHTGDLYSYFDVFPEEIKDLVDAKGIPKTSGSDQYGSHIAGIPDSRGAALIQNIINAPRFSKTNKDKTYRKVNLLYDYWEKLRRKPKKRK